MRKHRPDIVISSPLVTELGDSCPFGHASVGTDVNYTMTSDASVEFYTVEPSTIHTVVSDWAA